MNKNETKQLIMRTARKALIQNGYENTSLRDIARACNISLGSLCHYFKKKEFLAMELHSESMRLFQEIIAKTELFFSNPFEKYITIHYSYLHWVISQPGLVNLYLENTTIPAFRNLYVRDTNKILQDCVNLEEFHIEKWDAYVSCMVLSGAQFEMIYVYTQAMNEVDIKKTIKNAYQAQLYLLGLAESDIHDILIRGFQNVDILMEKSGSEIRNLLQ